MDSREAFGQSAPLTTRLKHIIDAYADGPGILLELVQNAGEHSHPALMPVHLCLTPPDVQTLTGAAWCLVVPLPV